MELTQERLKEVLHYDPETGVFTWRVWMGARDKQGDVAGWQNSEGYRLIRINKRLYTEHRLAWMYTHGHFPEKFIDHIDRNKLNNALSNLREVSREQNGLNRRPHANNTSGFTGVTWHKLCAKWAATIKIKSKTIHLGTFEDIKDAVVARREAEKTLGVAEFCPP